MPFNTKNRDYCPLCPREQFASRAILKSHWTESPRHAWCPMCERLFHSRVGLATHIEVVHGYQKQSKGATMMDRPVEQREVPELLVDTGDAQQRHGGQERSEANADIQSISSFSPEATHAASNPAPQTLDCFGCNRSFISYASMMLHLEEGECITSMAELAQIAESASYSFQYIVPGRRQYLRHQYGREELGFDTDDESIWECVECRKVFRSLLKASAHARSPAHKPKVYRCPSCRNEFTALSGLLQHVEQSSSCPEGVCKGSKTVGRLLALIADRTLEKEDGKPEPGSSSVSIELPSLLD